VTEENLQARIRGTLLMALSNKFGHLLLSTGNKSEMAVGYCTLYGDMNGGLSVISDLFKLQVYAICRRINARAGEELIPAAVIERPPSAELRADQLDEDSLPPYPVLDPILVGMLEDHIEDRAIADATGADLDLVRRIRRLTERSEFKRFQAPPTIRVSRKAWHGRRYPIVQRFLPE
jgi:NAD+ synthetase